MLHRYFAAAAAILLAAEPSLAHDTWVQPNAAVVRTGDAVYLDLKLGNHGNDHRDFKLAGKLSAASVQTFAVRAPDGTTYDLKPDLIDLGYAPKEGYLAAKFVPGRAGVYAAFQASDTVVNHGTPTRVVRSAKTFFLVADSLDKVAKAAPGFESRLGHGLELVPTASPVAPMGPGTPISVKLLHKGKPLARGKVSFVPRGATLKDGADPDYERTTDSDGKATFTPKTGNFYLVVAHLTTEEKGDTFEATKYSATLTVLVPEKCPCCGD